ncbi:MAG: OmpA family protein [Gammaproteobacteria bacterium]|nr:OmpA family protein [Gammaproteobacteria bacterium]
MVSLLRICIFLLVSSVFAAPVLAKKDIAGSKDHPLISRYSDSHIKKYSETDFDEVDIATGPAVSGKPRPPVKTLEAKVTTVIYETNTNKESVLKVFKNYIHSLKRSGFKKIYTCSNSACGPDFIKQLLTLTPRVNQYLGFDPWNTNVRLANFRYWSGSYKKGNKVVYTNLVVKVPTFSKYPVQIALDIIEPKEMELGLVTIDLNSLTEAMNTTGKAVLKGIYFDHNLAVVKPESKASLDVIAGYLKKNKTVSVYIVGHTDNTGADLHNMGLSKRRADAVVAKLMSAYSLRKERFKPHGVGPLVPVTSNGTDEGRAQNRRVEIVLMSR